MISYAKKKWGQNFLVDKNLLKKIVTTFNPKKEDRVLPTINSRQDIRGTIEATMI